MILLPQKLLLSAIDTSKFELAVRWCIMKQKTYDLGGEVHEILKPINISHQNANVDGKCVSLSVFATTESRATCIMMHVMLVNLFSIMEHDDSRHLIIL